MIRLLDLRDLRIVEVHIESNDLDALIQRLLNHIRQRFRLAMIDDDGLNVEIDRLQDLLALLRRILSAGEYPQVGAQRPGLCFGAGLIGLEEIAGGNIADQCDLDAALVERVRRAFQSFRPRHPGGQ
ncbi:hypothetical protein D3C87_1109640 [compost metagenome]